MGTVPFDTGKLPVEYLHDLLRRYAGHDERLVVGAQVGEDAAVLDMGDRFLVAKSDPITFATDDIGSYVVRVNANDVAVMGGTPRWFLLTLLLPENRTDRALVEGIMAQASHACQELGIVLCGGHTEVTFGLDRPIAVGLMLGEMDKADLVCTAAAQIGDDLILTKGIAIEGTSVLARELGGWLVDRVGAEIVERARSFLHDPGISVVQDARLVRRVGRPHAMHDPTEGGLATGLWEMALASGKGIVVEEGQVYLFPETQALCRVLDLDPWGLIASGALLVAAAPPESVEMVEYLQESGIGASVIGKIVDGPPHVQLQTSRGLVPLPAFDRDELARALAQVNGPRAVSAGAGENLAPGHQVACA